MCMLDLWAHRMIRQMNIDVISFSGNTSDHRRTNVELRGLVTSFEGRTSWHPKIVLYYSSLYVHAIIKAMKVTSDIWREKMVHDMQDIQQHSSMAKHRQRAARLLFPIRQVREEDRHVVTRDKQKENLPAPATCIIVGTLSVLDNDSLWWRCWLVVVDCCNEKCYYEAGLCEVVVTLPVVDDDDAYCGG